jgi:hypothetical protein
MPGRKNDLCTHEGSQDCHEVQTLVGGESACHVLPECPFDSEGVPESDEGPEEDASVSLESGSLARAAEVLARGAAREEVRLAAELFADGLRVRFRFVGEGDEVGPLMDAWPVSPEDLPSLGLELAKPNCSDACSVEPKVHPSHAAADGQHRWRVVR